LLLDQSRGAARYEEECQQVATIACFVVATRLVMYHALNVASGGSMDALELPENTTDPGRVKAEIAALLAHARRQTSDFELQLTTGVLDDIAFTNGRSPDVGRRWAALAAVVRQFDWTGPAGYVPGLYESLLDERHRHLMGVHYTPDAVAEIIGSYAIETAADIVLDPACGAGTFVTLAYDRKRLLGSSHEQALEESYGVEIADFAASLTGLGLALGDTAAASAYPRVVKADFFATLPGTPTGLDLPRYGPIDIPEAFDAVIGNPPYVRFESRTPEERSMIHAVLARRWMDQEVAYPNFTGKADIWAFFVAHAHRFLRPGGRLGFVLSWSLLCTDYGDAVMRFLARNFVIDAIIDSRVERFFAAKQNTLLLLARKAVDDPNPSSPTPNPNIDVDHPVRFVRLKQPVELLLNASVDRGKRADDLMEDLLGSGETGEDLRWDVRLVPQSALWLYDEFDTENEDEDDGGEAE
jgi:hypothetical protein